MVGSVLWKLDLLGHRVATGNTGVARVQLGIVNSLALRPVRSLEAIARKPIITPAGLALGAVRTVSTLLAIDIRAGQQTCVKAILSSLLLLLSGEVIRVEELVDNSLVLTDPVGEHAAMVAVVVDTPLHFNLFASTVGLHSIGAPVSGWLVVVDTITGVVTTGSAAADWCGVEVGPGGDGFEDRTFRARVDTGLESLVRFELGGSRKREQIPRCRDGFG